MEDYLFQFIDYKLIRLNFRVKEEFEKSVDVEINPRFSINGESKDNMLKVTFEAVLDNKDLPFSFEVCVGGMFEFRREVNLIEKIDKIININCAAILFPFLRETIADVTRRSGFTPLLLPPVNFCKIHEEMSKIKGEDTKKIN